MAIDSDLAKVDEVMTALYDIHDPEIGMSIVDLDLIKAVELGTDGAPTEIKMVLTTPFCPWAGELIQTVKTKTEEVVGPPVKVTLLAERWEPPPGLFYARAPVLVSPGLLDLARGRAWLLGGADRFLELVDVERLEHDDDALLGEVALLRLDGLYRCVADDDRDR